MDFLGCEGGRGRRRQDYRKKAGNAVITAQTQNGIKVECRVTVAEVKLNASLTVLKTGTSSNAVKIKEKFPKNDSVKSYQSLQSKAGKGR